MRLAIIAAMEEEIVPLKQQLQNRVSANIAGFEFLSGQLLNQEVVLAVVGTGKVNAAAGTTLLLQNFSCERVINIGVAAALADKLQIGDIVIADKLAYHDVDVVSLGYEYGQVPLMPLFYQADSLLIEMVTESANKITKQGQGVYVGLILSGDSFISKESSATYIRKQFPEVLAVEMESCAIAQVCHAFKVSFAIVRAISDSADHSATVDFRKFLQLAAENAAALVIELLSHL